MSYLLHFVPLSSVAFQVSFSIQIFLYLYNIREQL